MQNAETIKLSRQYNNRFAEQHAINVGDHVRLISGELANLSGVIVRCERNGTYVVGVPDEDSPLLIGVHRQRFRRLNTKTKYPARSLVD